MGLEIERKFLVDKQQWADLKKPEGTVFKQGYLLNEKEKSLRIRIAGEQAFITIKGATTGFIRKEYEYEIPKADAQELLDNFTGSTIGKTRFCIDFKGKTWEVDVFAGKNEGLIIAEIELESEDETFEKPDWVSQEVTVDTRYFNVNLVKHPYKSW